MNDPFGDCILRFIYCTWKHSWLVNGRNVLKRFTLLFEELLNIVLILDDPLIRTESPLSRQLSPSSFLSPRR